MADPLNAFDNIMYINAWSAFATSRGLLLSALRASRHHHALAGGVSGLDRHLGSVSTKINSIHELIEITPKKVNRHTTLVGILSGIAAGIAGGIIAGQMVK